MTIEVHDGIMGLWFVAWENTDWLGAVWREPDGLHAKYRFRYYVDDKVLSETQDRKHWYELKPGPKSQLGIIAAEPEPEDDLVATLSVMAQELATRMRGKRWEVLRGTGTLEQFWEEFKKMPFAHGEELTPAEFAKKYPEYLKP